jgi:acyl-coenzyme A thioesterase PaaI-like protein
MMQPPEDSAYRAMLALAASPPNATGRLHLSAGLRRLGAIVAASDASDQESEEIASLLDQVRDRVERHAEASRYPLGERLGGSAGLFVNHPVIGSLNPCAPPLTVVPDGPLLVGTATYGTPFEGPPGCVHGGHIAAAFDSMVVMTAGINGLAGFTRSLTIHYRRPAPLGVPLVYEGQVESTRDRSTIVGVVLRHNDLVCAECTGDVATRAPSRQ